MSRTTPTPVPAIALLEPLASEAEALVRAHTEEVREGLQTPVCGTAAIITRGQGRLTEAVLRAAGPSLRCVARVGAGTDNIDVAAATALGIPVFYAPDAFTAATAEHGLALLLALARRIAALDAAVRAGDWSARASAGTTDLGGKRLGIVGLGRIGRRFGELGRALGMEVVAWSRTSRDARFPHTDLDELLATSDVVSLHMSLEPETRGFLDAARIAALKRGAMVLNVARGGLVDERALAGALRSGHLRGAAVDVLSQEPPAADHPLIGLPNVLITPHVGALTDGAFRQACLQIAGAVVAFLRGEAPDRGLVRNPEVLPDEAR